VGEVHARDAEASGGDLLHGAPTLGVEEALDVLSALARVGLAAQTVHGDRESLVRLLGDGAVAHRTGREALDDGLDGFDLVERDRGSDAVLEREHAAQRREVLGLVVDELGVLAEDVVSPSAGGVLEPEHGVGVEQVLRPLAAPLVLAAGRQPLVSDDRAVGRVGAEVALLVLGRDHVDADAAEHRRRAREVRVDELAAETHGLERLGGGVAGDRRDPHLRHDLEDALAERLDQVVHGVLGREPGDHAGSHEVLARLHRQVRVDRRGAVADEGRDVVDLADIARLDDETDLHAVLGTDQVVVDRRDHEQRRHGCPGWSRGRRAR
jgi:hypothetical protein